MGWIGEISVVLKTNGIVTNLVKSRHRKDSQTAVTSLGTHCALPARCTFLADQYPNDPVPYRAYKSVLVQSVDKNSVDLVRACTSLTFELMHPLSLQLDTLACTQDFEPRPTSLHALVHMQMIMICVWQHAISASSGHCCTLVLYYYLTLAFCNLSVHKRRENHHYKLKLHDVLVALQDLCSQRLVTYPELIPMCNAVNRSWNVMVHSSYSQSDTTIATPSQQLKIMCIMVIYQNSCLHYLANTAYPY